jgi:hypothetical protein
MHPLLTPTSPVVAVARTHAASPGAHARFLCPWSQSLPRATVLNCLDERTDHLSAMVVLSTPNGHAEMGLTDLQVLGALLEGWPLARTSAECAVPGLAHHLEHLARHLGCPSIHALLRHASAEGLYIPPPLWP